MHTGTALALSALCVAAVASPSHSALVRPPDMARREVRGHVLVSYDQPKIQVRVDKAFVPLPVLGFAIKNSTWAERYIFVDAGADRTIRRMLIVQFEQALPNSTFRFHYPPNPPIEWGGETYRKGAFALDDAKEMTDNPDAEVSQTRRYLATRGYQSGMYWHVARLARVSDPSGNTEIIVFYEEAVTQAAFAAPRSENDDGLPSPLADALFTRLKAVITPNP